MKFCARYVMAFTLLSPHFEPMGEIPTKYTCDGQNVSPALQWRNPPEGTKSFALIVDDPDIPFGIKDSHGKILSIWDHWVLFNIPSSVSELPEAIQSLPAGTQNGQGSHGKEGYYGPCPPDKRYRYFFKLYALDTFLSLAEGVTKQEVEEAMKGHIIGKIELMGTYARPRRL